MTDETEDLQVEDIDFKPLIALVASGQTLTERDAERAFDIIMTGNATPAQIGAFLMGLRVRGETVDEITAAARVLRSKAVSVQAPEDAIDVVGTGGDGVGTYNISTAASIVAAAAGARVAKHGNRAASSRSGSADVLGELGLNLDAPPEVFLRCMEETGIGFMFAQRYHGAMKHVGPMRYELGVRTIFNLLGPLANPVAATFELMGIYSEQWLEPIAETLGRLGLKRAWVVHGSDGLDEITTTGPTHVAEFHQGTVRRFQIVPEDAGLPRASLEDLKGDDAAFNARAIRDLFAGVRSPYRDVVLLNAAAAIVITGLEDTLRDGVGRAAAAIDSGRAGQVLDLLVRLSNEPPPAGEAP
ncbi:anthranilate phosphoribosyltransferase [Phaeovibrio sulfidiphilus]|uniref:Anthranilate phosphoribosyltransferase n=1 Tax=Phaeovibrio sulfidiphilus TaxID=1220600 RepID=A0A8J6YVG2_9PROT|nr:anthranilate phosphoribosyltransferase [Phaeovibrio sulfidiphilus]MBE1237139.1 anthranilate phosphoribosyltransferase [Phaeovibrio sulfidiphilus]